MSRTKSLPWATYLGRWQSGESGFFQSQTGPSQLINYTCVFVEAVCLIPMVRSPISYVRVCPLSGRSTGLAVTYEPTRLGKYVYQSWFKWADLRKLFYLETKWGLISKFTHSLSSIPYGSYYIIDSMYEHLLWFHIYVAFQFLWSFSACHLIELS